jgi:DNA sulfur modification protein DndC
MRTDLNLFGIKRIDFNEQIKLTCESVNAYGQFHDHWAVAWSMGKDSTTLLTLLISLIESGQIMKPKSLTVLRADTRMELPPLWIASEKIVEKLKGKGIEVRTVMADVDDRFMVYILGHGVPPPSNTFRWCTGQIKIEPMERALQDLYAETGEKILMLTGVRQGESAIRDGKIHMSCAKGDAECGQGWYQTGLDSDLCSTLAPLLHWRVCSVWDWLKVFAPSIGYGAWPTAILADAYGGEEAEEIAARTGCIGCPLVQKEKSLMEVLKIDKWKFLAPLMELKPIYREMRLPMYRHRKSGGELKKDGTLGKNQQRLGPLTLEARTYFLEKILNIQSRINSGSQNEKLYLINQEEENRIRELIENKTFPNKWTGEEVTGDIILDKKYSDGSVMPVMFREWIMEPSIVK